MYFRLSKSDWSLSNFTVSDDTLQNLPKHTFFWLRSIMDNQTFQLDHVLTHGSVFCLFPLRCDKLKWCRRVVRQPNNLALFELLFAYSDSNWPSNDLRCSRRCSWNVCSLFYLWLLLTTTSTSWENSSRRTRAEQLIKPNI